MRAGIQLYTLRDVDEPLPAIVRRVADAGFEGVEFAYRVPDADTAAVLDALEGTGLAAPSAHVPIEEIEDDPEGTAAAYRDLGCATLVVPGLHEEHFTAAAGVERAVERLSSAAARLREQDVALCYHNHEREFAEVDGTPAFDTILDRTTIGFEVDVGLAALAGVDPTALLGNLHGRVPLVHLKDVDRSAGASVPLGEGDLDLEAIAGAAARAGTEWLIYEYEGEAPLDSLEPAAERLRAL